MQTLLSAEFQGTAQGAEAADILKSCVRCGFCTATCPTYQLLGDELDGPRGRIQLIKQVLEGNDPTPVTQLHLDRCLTCRACETACPSGVRYGALLDIGRDIVDARVPRPWSQRVVRALLRALLTGRAFTPLYRLGQGLARPLPSAWRPRLLRFRSGAARGAGAPQRAPPPTRRVLLLAGCVQPGMAPEITQATQRVLARLGIEALIVPAAGCCGSVRQHLGDPEGALDEARRNLDAWQPWLAQGAEAVLSENSGCSLMLSDYGRLLAHDARYRESAARLSSLGTDLAALLERELATLQAWPRPSGAPLVAFQAPCTLQHGLKSRGVVERILLAAGARLAPVAESQLCCGAAGTYSLLQPAISAPLRARKLAALTDAAPEQILSANIGCIMHLAGATPLPVRHWVEWLDERLQEAPS